MISLNSVVGVNYGVQSSKKATEDPTKAQSNAPVASYAAVAAKAVDKNEDGVISLDEYSEQIKHAGGADADATNQYSRLDADKDGSVSVHELASTIKLPLFSFADGLTYGVNLTRPATPSGMVLNSKGQIADAEMFYKSTAAIFDEAITVVPSERDYRLAVAAAIDADKDGKISSLEYASQIEASGGSEADATNRFSELDKNGDGLVSLTEVAASIKTPDLNTLAGALHDALARRAAGEGVETPPTHVLDKSGQVADPSTILLSMLKSFGTSNS